MMSEARSRLSLIIERTWLNIRDGSMIFANINKVITPPVAFWLSVTFNDITAVTVQDGNRKLGLLIWFVAAFGGTPTEPSCPWTSRFCTWHDVSRSCGLLHCTGFIYARSDSRAFCLGRSTCNNSLFFCMCPFCTSEPLLKFSLFPFLLLFPQEFGSNFVPWCAIG